MLIGLGRVKEAVEYGSKHLRTPDETLAVAGTLREQGELEEALRIGEHGLSLGGRKGSLAIWMRDLASDLTSYQRVRELSGEGWPKHRVELLDYLRQSTSYSLRRTGGCEGQGTR